MGYPVIDIVNNGWNWAIGWLLILSIGMYAIMIWFTMKSLGNLSIYNTDEDAVYEVVVAVLNELRLPYEEKRGKLLLTDINSTIQLNFQTPFKTATVYLHKIKDKNIRSQIGQRFIKYVTMGKINSFPNLALVFILIGILEMIMGIKVFMYR
jgi:hypothetical protein